MSFIRCFPNQFVVWRRAEIHIPVSRGNVSNARTVRPQETSPLPVKAMRKSFAQPQFLSKRRLYAICPYFNPYYLSLRPLFAERLASTSAAKQPISKTPLINKPSSASDFTQPTYSRADFEQEYTPRPLPRPLGQLQPPQPGENTGVDPRSWRERRDDFWNYDKHLARRRQLYVFPLTCSVCFQDLSSGDRADK